jgi:hypothetical protein
MKYSIVLLLAFAVAALAGDHEGMMGMVWMDRESQEAYKVKPCEAFTNAWREDLYESNPKPELYWERSLVVITGSDFIAQVGITSDNLEGRMREYLLTYWEICSWSEGQTVKEVATEACKQFGGCPEPGPEFPPGDIDMSQAPAQYMRERDAADLEAIQRTRQKIRQNPGVDKHGLFPQVPEPICTQ